MDCVLVSSEVDLGLPHSLDYLYSRFRLFAKPICQRKFCNLADFAIKRNAIQTGSIDYRCRDIDILFTWN
jgi:hypothetical protein